MADNFADGTIHVQYGHLDGASDDMLQQTRAIKQALDHLDQELNPLKQSWESGAREAYNTAKQAWDQTVENMRLDLQSHSQLLSHISENYKTSDNQLANMWSGVKAG